MRLCVWLRVWSAALTTSGTAGPHHRCLSSFVREPEETCGGLHTYLPGAAIVLFSRFSVRKAAHAQSTPPWEKRCDATKKNNLLLKTSRVHTTHIVGDDVFDNSVRVRCEGSVLAWRAQY